MTSNDNTNNSKLKTFSIPLHQFVRLTISISMHTRKLFPNIIICGTTGVGKTRLSQALCTRTNSLVLIEINRLVEEQKLKLSDDPENRCQIIDDEALRQYLDDEYFEKSPFSSPSGLVIDYHSAGLIPDHNHVHAVFVLRCNPNTLAERLGTRGYSTDHIESRTSLEKFDVCLNEARESFHESMVYQLINETETDFDNNLVRLTHWIQQWPLQSEFH